MECKGKIINRSFKAQAPSHFGPDMNALTDEALSKLQAWMDENGVHNIIAMQWTRYRPRFIEEPLPYVFVDVMMECEHEEKQFDI